MINTFWWVLSVVGLSTLLGFIIALVLNQKFRGRKIARSILIFPWATSLVIQASVWNYIIKYEYGNLNNVLLNLGIIRSPINWRVSYQVEFIWECGVGIFVTIPFVDRFPKNAELYKAMTTKLSEVAVEKEETTDRVDAVNAKLRELPEKKVEKCGKEVMPSKTSEVSEG